MVMTMIYNFEAVFRGVYLFLHQFFFHINFFSHQFFLHHFFAFFYTNFFPKNLFLNFKIWCKKSKIFGVKKIGVKKAKILV